MEGSCRVKDGASFRTRVVEEGAGGTGWVWGGMLVDASVAASGTRKRADHDARGPQSGRTRPAAVVLLGSIVSSFPFGGGMGRRS